MIFSNRWFEAEMATLAARGKNSSTNTSRLVYLFDDPIHSVSGTKIKQ